MQIETRIASCFELSDTFQLYRLRHVSDSVSTLSWQSKVTRVDSFCALNVYCTLALKEMQC